MASDIGHDSPVSTLPIDSDVLNRARFSVSRLAGQEDVFTRQLHDDLEAMIPALPSLLAANGWPFCQRMVQAVLWVVMTDQPFQVVAAQLRQVGAANRLEGFPEAKYPSVARALIRTLRDLSGEYWSTSTGSAWISCFQWIEPHLIIGAQQAALDQQARAEAPPHVPAQPQEPPAAGPAGADDDLESVAGLLDDEDEDDEGYGQIMVSMSSWRPHREDEE